MFKDKFIFSPYSQFLIKNIYKQGITTVI